MRGLNLWELEARHKGYGKLATITAASAEQRFGVLEWKRTASSGNAAKKSVLDGDRINGGYMALEPEMFGLIARDAIVLEKDVQLELGRLMAEYHRSLLLYI